MQVFGLKIIIIIIIFIIIIANINTSNINTRRLGANSPPKCQKEPLKVIKEPPKICIEFNAEQISECYFHESKLEK